MTVGHSLFTPIHIQVNQQRENFFDSRKNLQHMLGELESVVWDPRPRLVLEKQGIANHICHDSQTQIGYERKLMNYDLTYCAIIQTMKSFFLVFDSIMTIHIYIFKLIICSIILPTFIS